jgi:hypothetical protein
MRVGNREILSSGSIVTQYGDDSVEIDLAGLCFKLVFKSGEGKPSVAGEGDEKLLTLSFTNFDNPLGIAWSSEIN